MKEAEASRREARGTLTALRERLRSRRGAAYWRSLEELAGTPELHETLRRELPSHASEWDSTVDRRRFLQLASASLALAGVTGCTKQPIEQIVPYVRQPEQLVPGHPLFFATARTLAGYATGLLAESHTGRPTKLEGNPDHPASLGRCDVQAQASVLDLYDPDRSQAVTQLGQIRTWGAFVDQMGPKVAALKAIEGEGLAILTGTVTSPTLHALLAELRAEMPKAKWHQHEPAGRDNVRRGARAAFGEDVETRYDLARADVVVALDSDFLTQGPGAVRYAHDFARRRKVHDYEAAKRDGMSRFYAVESTVTATGTVADHRLALRPTEVALFAAALAARLGVGGAATPSAFAGDAKLAAWVDAVVEDLEAHRGRGLVVAGDYVDAEVQTLAHAVNAALGNVGSTVIYTEPVEPEPVDQAASLAELVADMEAGRVDTLLVLGVNPVYDAPADLDVGAALEKVPLRVHLGSHRDETSAFCHWHINEAHYLETWTDARAWDGTVSIGQPLVVPLYNGKTAAEVLAVLLGRTLAADELLRQHYWQTEWVFLSEADFEKAWRRALHDGLVADTTLPAKAVALDASAVAAAASAIGGWTPGELELVFRPDPHLFDGRFANNGWLQECPRPITKLTWDNALLMSPKTAREAGLGDLVAGHNQSQDAPLVTVAVGERSLTLPVWVVPGHAEKTLTLHLGYGRTRAGRVAEGSGFDAYRLRESSALWRLAEGVSLRRARGRYRLASTQDHHSMEGRHIVLGDRLDSYLEDPEGYKPHLHVDPAKSLMSGEEFPYEGHAWGMSVDLTACTGCNACVVACQSENNVPVVGKEQVLKGREMHWIRIDRYYAGDDADHVDEMLHQPVFCMHCEQAPCEVVCPVGATVHSHEGLNDMVYNRCVGTRYCSNNCPYKVRRFNFLLFQDFETPSLQLGRNPDVTVRSRGVMEKCSYCVQRISRARITAKKERREIRDGEIVTACQQACPSDALIFGDLNDAAAAVSKAKSSPLDYSLLEELGTRPRTTFLARIRNPNPKLEPPEADGDRHEDGEAHS